MNPDDTNNTDDAAMPPVDPQAVPADDGSQDSPQVGGPAHEPVLQHAPTAPVQQVSGTPDKADDVDLIEKAWVEKAKEIVDQTHGDPFTQSKQLNQVKADYIKKRYGRDVKTDE